MNQNWNEKFKKVFIDKEVKDSEMALRFMEIFGSKAQVIQGLPPNYEKGELTAHQFAQSKKQIHLTKFKGRFFKKCPGFQKGMACCNYFVLNLGFQCDMDCSYCYLQSFINSNYLTLYTNIEDALEELNSLTQWQDQPLRVGTGEVMDSLSMDPLTLYSRQLISFFKQHPAWKLEFKTKSDQVEQFLDCDHGGNVIVSWSLNPPHIIEAEEHGTAPFHARLGAAEKCLKKAYPVSFHLDPMVWHPEWKHNYGFLIHELTKRFSPKDISYLSLGALRFQPEQKNMMRERFGMNSLVTQGETFKSKDGKLRYDYDLRKEMFEFVLQTFREHDSRWKIFICMEAPETWLDTFGHSPHREKPLKELFQPLSPRPRTF